MEKRVGMGGGLGVVRGGDGCTIVGEPGDMMGCGWLGGSQPGLGFCARRDGLGLVVGCCVS